MSLKTSIQLLTESPGYEDIFDYFKQEYGKNVLTCPEEGMVDMRRRYDWLDEFKRDLDNFNCENSHE